jgi:hypothetical protein
MIFLNILKRQLTDQIFFEQQITNQIFQYKKEMEEYDKFIIQNFLNNNVKEIGITKIIFDYAKQTKLEKEIEYNIELFSLAPYLLYNKIKPVHTRKFIIKYYTSWLFFISATSSALFNKQRKIQHVKFFTKYVKQWNDCN